MTEKLAYRVPEAAEMLSIGETTMQRLINEGQIKIVKFDRVTVVPAEELRQFLANRQSPVTKAAQS